MRRLAVVALALMLTGTAAAAPRDDRLTVFAAASLTRVLPKIDATPHYQFAGTNS